MPITRTDVPFQAWCGTWLAHGHGEIHPEDKPWSQLRSASPHVPRAANGSISRWFSMGTRLGVIDDPGTHRAGPPVRPDIEAFTPSLTAQFLPPEIRCDISLLTQKLPLNLLGFIRIDFALIFEEQSMSLTKARTVETYALQQRNEALCLTPGLNVNKEADQWYMPGKA